VRPLALVAGGIALVVLDFRTESLDLLPDPVGWALIAVAALARARTRLGGRSPRDVPSCQSAPAA